MLITYFFSGCTGKNQPYLSPAGWHSSPAVLHPSDQTHLIIFVSVSCFLYLKPSKTDLNPYSKPTCLRPPVYDLCPLLLLFYHTYCCFLL